MAGLPPTQYTPPSLDQSLDQVIQAAQNGAELELVVPSETVGLIIGKGGSTIRSIQESIGHGCHIVIPCHDDAGGNHTRTIRISAMTMEACGAAATEVERVAGLSSSQD